MSRPPQNEQENAPSSDPLAVQARAAADKIAGLLSVNTENYKYPEPLAYLNMFDGIKLVQFHLTGVLAKDII